MADRKVNKAVEEFIANHRGEMSERELANALGLSKTTVHRAILRLGVAPDGSQKPPQKALPVADEPEKSQLVLLRELARVQRSMIRDATPANLPALSKEYRETLMAIEAIERRDEKAKPQEAPEEANPFLVISSRFARPRAAAPDKAGAGGL